MKRKSSGKQVVLTKREAEALMTAADLAVHVYGAPDCPKCARAFFSAVEKIDVAFKLGVTDAPAS